jgi:hypothetical protein
MKVITANEFLETPIQVQKELKLWMQNNYMCLDRFSRPYDNGSCFDLLILSWVDKNKFQVTNILTGKQEFLNREEFNELIPNFSLDQLITIIEKYFNGKLDIEYVCDDIELSVWDIETTTMIKSYMAFNSNHLIYALLEMICHIVEEYEDGEKRSSL